MTAPSAAPEARQAFAKGPDGLARRAAGCYPLYPTEIVGFIPRLPGVFRA
jgi:hypothetical protein